MRFERFALTVLRIYADRARVSSKTGVEAKQRPDDGMAALPLHAFAATYLDCPERHSLSLYPTYQQLFICLQGENDTDFIAFPGAGSKR